MNLFLRGARAFFFSTVSWVYMKIIFANGFGPVKKLGLDATHIIGDIV
jgi:hypothetical protein